MKKQELEKAAASMVNALTQSYIQMLEDGFDQETIFEEAKSFLIATLNLTPIKAANMTRLLIHLAAKERSPYTLADLKEITALVAA